jgi:integrase
LSIFKRGNVYWFHFYFEGRHIQRSTKQGNPRVARSIEAAYRTKLAKGEVGIHDKQPVPQFRVAMEEFLNWSKHEHVEHPRTHQRYRTSSKALLKFFGPKQLNDISTEDVERFKLRRSDEIGCRTKRKLRPATVNREIACGKAMFNFIAKGNVALQNPFRGVRLLAENNEQTRVLSYEEQAKYLNAASQPLRDIAVLMLETGMRPEEVCRISRENVHLERGYVFNPWGKTKAAKRRVPLTNAALAVLRSRLARDTGCFLFPHAKTADRPMVKVNNAHDRAVRKSRVAKFRLYDLRHTFATRAVMAGVDLVTLAAILGHSRIQMVLRYAHPSEQHQAEAMKRVEAFSANQQVAEFEKKAQQSLQIPLQ